MCQLGVCVVPRCLVNVISGCIYKEVIFICSSNFAISQTYQGKVQIVAQEIVNYALKARQNKAFIILIYTDKSGYMFRSGQ